MRVLFVLGAFACALFMVFASIAEDMGAPTLPLPFMFVADKVLALACLLMCVLALVKTRIATAIIWVLIVVHDILSAVRDEPGQFTRGLLEYAIFAALFMTVGAFFEGRTD